MDGMTMDLFPDEAEAPAAPPRPTRDLARLTRVLEEAMSAAGRKAALKTMSEVERLALIDAVDVVATHKRDAYARAYAGAPPDSLGWTHRQPALAAATALLHASMLGNELIPMAPAE